jgi:hypothetical protein
LNDEIFKYSCQLEDEVVKTVGRDRGAALISAILRSRTNIQSELIAVSEWFNLVEKLDVVDFTLGTAIDVALTQMKDLKKNAKVVEEVKIQSDRVLAGRYLPYFIDIILILIDNIFRHSAVEPHGVFNVRAVAGVNDQSVFLEFKNNIGPGLDREGVVAKLSALLEKMALPEIDEMVTREGGTGYLKIYKIIKRNLRSNRIVIDPCLTENEFRTVIEFDVEGLLTEDENTDS